MVNAPQDRLHGRNGDIWRDYISGRNQEWCAAKYGLSQSRVSAIINEVRAVIKEEGKAKDDWRQEALELMMETQATLAEIIRSEPPPVFHAGEILRDADGNEVPDRSGYYSAVAHMDKLQTRMARLMGWDAPVAVEQVGDLRVTVEGVDVDRLT